MVPGLTGSRLVDRSSGVMIWGTSRRVFFPKDLGYSNALPIDDELLAADRIEPDGLLGELSFLGWKKPIYGPLIRAMQADGRSLGSLENPRPEDDLYLFAYDWRRENKDAVERLAESLRRISAQRPGTRFDLVCQSNATRICRYLAKYGAPAQTTVASASSPARRTLPLFEPAHIRQLVLVGVSNGGSLRQLRELHRGRRYVPGVGRFMAPETLATLRPLFEDLPLAEDGDVSLFLDSDGREIEVDLYDVASWQRYGWSWFDREVERRISDRDAEGLFGTRSERVRYTARQLADAQVTGTKLRSDSPLFPPTTGYCLLLNSTLETPARAVLRREDDRWQTLFADDPETRELDPALRSRLSEPGDGHATVQSQLALSDQETAAVWRRHQVSGGHFDTVVEPATHRAVLDCLNGYPPASTATEIRLRSDVPQR